MDVLATMRADELRTTVWVAAIATTIFMAALQFILPITRSSRRSWLRGTLALLKSLRGGAAAYAVTSLVVAFYVLANAADSRWSEGKDAHIDMPELTSAMPLFDGMVNTLNDFANMVESRVNEALAIKNALTLSGDFTVMTLWGLAAMLCAAIPAMLVGRSIEAGRARHVDELTVRQRDLEAQLADLRQQLGRASAPRE